ncbi:hypothetical protein HPG69_009636 [Diceros bicornis minor]|uniref:Uncharacterized protein n=1 Tax=Diceros bicornis minor TaxID=77932 RepID=A0A7J7EY67_DICBM|nr:hypothetical protein HPG69_009636 [Diceros bicornis minor]
MNTDQDSPRITTRITKARDTSVDHYFVQSETWRNGNSYYCSKIVQKHRLHWLGHDSQERSQPLQHHYFQTLKFCSLYEAQEELMRMVAEELIRDCILTHVYKEKGSSPCPECC